MARRAVALVTGWVIVNVDEDASFVEVVRAAKIESCDTDQIWTDTEINVGSNQPVRDDQIIVILRGIPEAEIDARAEETDEEEEEETEAKAAQTA